MIQGQENIPAEAAEPTTGVSNIGMPVKNARPLNSSSHAGKTGSGHRNAVIGIIILAIIIVAVAYVLYVKGEEQKLMDQGCIPAAWDQFGIVSIWDCPVGVTGHGLVPAD